MTIRDIIGLVNLIILIIINIFLFLFIKFLDERVKGKG